ncbi:Lanthionine synthetase C-like protein [Actinomadura rubteroloni]|uniref:Lanthionine synthetase C-like protein n=1 Tax=Actinomadura rubteroloni TaxID=1926885 RepID=A0A2P4UCX8_9ACTN|nr:type 2 lanthipeptide synthetase LanM family protein [Actinomadura rubteroloni]POM22897.1 Lanthionine synthetase C-like protein [Actinomadura rubteroloni]
MNPSYPADIAARAATLAERTQIVSALGPPPDTGPLEPFDAWKIDRLAARLAQRFQKEGRRQGGAARHTGASLTDVLTAYRRHELAMDGADGPLGSALADLHGDWLTAYRGALDAFQRPSDTAAGWREPDVYYGRLAIACEPFLVELGRRLTPVLDASGLTIAPRVVEVFQEHLLDRFALALAWAVEADAKVYCRLRDIDPETSTREDYLAYLDKTFADAASYHRFYLEYPVLGRWLAHVTDLLAAHGRELAVRLRADAAAIGDAFFGRPLGAVRDVRLGGSDAHAGARGVVMVDAELADGSPAPFVYKPRCVGGEAALQGLLARLRADGVVGFAERAVLPRDGYGYEALIPPGRNRVATRAEAARVYTELGGYLAIFYVLGGGDLHFENVLVADGHAYICDCETVLGALPKGQPRPAGTLMDSVFKTGLIEWPAAPDADGAGMRLSGYSGGDAYEIPMPIPKIDDRPLSFTASVTHRTGLRVEPGAANRVFVGDELTRAEDFVDEIKDGFGRVHRWFQEDPERAAECVGGLFDGTRVRFVNWSTQIYVQLLSAARHPKCLMEPLEVDLLFNTVRTFPRNWDQDGVLPAYELESMWRLDVPLFWVDAADDRLVHDHRAVIPATLEAGPLEHAAARIRRLTPENRAQQDQYIAAGLSGGDVTSSDFAATCVAQAAGLGQRLCATLRAPDAPAPWISYIIRPDGRDEVDIEGDLYNGSAGIALFLAYLNDLDPRPEFRTAARRALDHALATGDRDRIGAFPGLGGLIYVLLHLHRLWGDRALLDQAVAMAETLDGRIERDPHLDVFHGVAGLVPVLLALDDATGGDRGTALAHRCAAHLLRHARDRGDGLSWSNSDPRVVLDDLTGLSHGSAGIGWALILLGTRTGRDEYVDAGRRAFAYETRHFDADAQDWYDLRTVPGGPTWRGRHYANAWCNGASGIGLTRIASWALLGGDDEPLLTEAHQALTATMRNFPRLANDSLCHGRTGNAELFLRYALLRDQPAFRLEANVQVQSQWRDLDQARPGPEAGFFPGLMLGMAGFGLHFLRLARPERVPSVLLLDPPPARTKE